MRLRKADAPGRAIGPRETKIPDSRQISQAIQRYPLLFFKLNSPVALRVFPG